MSDILYKIARAVEKGSFLKLRNGEFNFIKVFGMINIHDDPVYFIGSHTQMDILVKRHIILLDISVRANG
jgi:hypothetical protein